MDSITRGMMETYLRRYPEVVGRGEADQFEFFASSLLLKDWADARTDTDIDSFIAGHGIEGYDFFAEMVNEQLITDVIDLETVITSPRSVEIDFHFAQFKTSDGTDWGDFLKFLETVKGVITSSGEVDTKRFPCASFVKETYKHAGKFRENPRLTLTYVIGGSNPAGTSVRDSIAKFKEEIRDTNLVSEVNVEIMDASKIQEAYRQLTQGYKQAVEMPGKKAFGKINEVSDAYIGLLSVDDVFKLVTHGQDEERPFGKLTKPVFSENVRDYLGHVEVNREILGTLEGPHPDWFPVLNNGITIVAQGLKPTGDTLSLSGYQIVNGCQTVHVLFEYFSQIAKINPEKALGKAKNLNVVTKVVSTEHTELSRSISQATNQQTRVSPENLLANLDIQYKIEEYFRHQDMSEVTLYYERRDRQWADENIEQGVWRIISVRHMIQSFASCYLKLPHQANRYYTDLRDQAKESIFKSDFALPYFWVAALFYCRLEFLFRNQKISSEYKPIKFHIMAGIVRGVVKQRINLPVSESHAKKQLRDLVDILSDDDRLIEMVNLAGEVARNISSTLNRDFARRQEDSARYIENVKRRIRNL